MAKLIQHRNKCIGCGVCENMQPEYWRMSKKDGKATLLNSQEKNKVFILQIVDKNISLAMQTAKACPVRIIAVQ